MGAVYDDLTPVVRNPTDIIGGDPQAGKPPAPTAKNKWLTASVVDDAATIISQIFGEAQRRDPDHQRTWIAMVDGAKHQIYRIETEAKGRQVEVHIVCDFVHVLEYIWSSAWSFFAEGDPAAEERVADKALAVLRGQASTVAAGIRREATCMGPGCWRPGERRQLRRTTCSPSATTSTTAARSNRDGRSPPV